MKSSRDARARSAWLRMAADTSRSLAALQPDSRAAPAAARTRRHDIGHAWARRLIRALGVEVTVRGAPLPGPHLLLGNHRSYIDILAVLGRAPVWHSWPRPRSRAGRCSGAAARLHPTVFVDARRPRQPQARARGRARLSCRRGSRSRRSRRARPAAVRASCPSSRACSALAEQYDFPVVPFALEYEDRADAWVDDDPFVGHFLRTFGKPRVRLHLSFGPTLRRRTGETTAPRRGRLDPRRGARAPRARWEPAEAALDSPHGVESDSSISRRWSRRRGSGAREISSSRSSAPVSRADRAARTRSCTRSCACTGGARSRRRARKDAGAAARRRARRPSTACRRR